MARMLPKQQQPVAVARPEAPVPFITLQENGKFRLHDEALRVFEKIQGRVGVVAVAGLYRTGKSYLLNRLLGRQEGFEIGPTVDACTKGLYIWGSPMRVERPSDGGGPLSVVFVDTEGLGSTAANRSHDARIFTLAALLSSLLVYNSMGTIDEGALDKLGLVSQLAAVVRARSGNARQQPQPAASSVAELAPFLPRLLWVVRDFTLKHRDGDGDREYLERALQDVPGLSVDTASKNAVRASIRNAFAQRDCATLVRPVLDERQLQQVDRLPWNSLRPEFRQQMDALRTRVLADVPPKCAGAASAGAPVLNGPALATLSRAYVDALNNNAVPVIADTWAAVVRQQAERARVAARDAFRQCIRRDAPPLAATDSPAATASAVMPLNDAALDALLQRGRQAALDAYAAESLNGSTAADAERDEWLRTEEAAIRVRNGAATRARCEPRVRELVRALEARVEARAIGSAEMLYREWERQVVEPWSKEPGSEREKREILASVQGQLPVLLGRLERAVLAERTEAIRRAEERAQTMQEERARLQKESSEAASREDRAMKEAERSRAEVTRLRADVERAERAAAAVRTDSDAQRQVMDAGVAQLRAAVAVAERLEAQSRNEARSLLSLVETLRNDIARLQSELQQTKAERDEARRQAAAVGARANNIDSAVRRSSAATPKSTAPAADRKLPEKEKANGAAEEGIEEIEEVAEEGSEEGEEEEEQSGGNKENGGAAMMMMHSPRKRGGSRREAAAAGQKKRPRAVPTALDPNKMTVAQLKEVLAQHNVRIPAVQAKKDVYVELFERYRSQIEAVSK